MAIAVNEELCSGCRVCEVLCALYHFKQINPKKAALRVEGHFPDPGKFSVHYCNQCGKCAEVCPVEAIREESGVYRIDSRLCTNCGICVQECPRGVMYSLPGLDTPVKCDMCGECVEWCPRKAIFIEGDE